MWRQLGLSMTLLTKNNFSARLTNSPAWQALLAHAQKQRAVSIADLFAQDENRLSYTRLQLESLTLDFSKTRISQETQKLLHAFAEQQQLSMWRDHMMQGEKINTTEDVAVLHMGLRSFEKDAYPFSDDVFAAREKALNFAEKT